MDRLRRVSAAATSRGLVGRCPAWPAARLLARRAVDRLAKQIRVARVPSRLLDHVDQYPAETPRASLARWPRGRLIEARRLCDHRAAAGGYLAVARAKFVGLEVRGGAELELGVGRPVHGVPRLDVRQVEEVHAEPPVLDEREVVEQPTEGQRRGRVRPRELLPGQPLGLEQYGLAEEVEETAEQFEFGTGVRRVGAHLGTLPGAPGVTVGEVEL